MRYAFGEAARDVLRYRGRSRGRRGLERRMEGRGARGARAVRLRGIVGSRDGGGGELKSRLPGRSGRGDGGLRWMRGGPFISDALRRSECEGNFAGGGGVAALSCGADGPGDSPPTSTAPRPQTADRRSESLLRCGHRRLVPANRYPRLLPRACALQ